MKRYVVTIVTEVEAETMQMARNTPLRVEGVLDWWVAHVEEVPNSPAEVPNSE